MYIAKDKDGGVFLYSNKTPRIRWDEWSNGESVIEIDDTSVLQGIPWDESLHEVTILILPNIPPDPREELKVDDKVWVWDRETEDAKFPRYF